MRYWLGVLAALGMGIGTWLSTGDSGLVRWAFWTFIGFPVAVLLAMALPIVYGVAGELLFGGKDGGGGEPRCPGCSTIKPDVRANGSCAVCGRPSLRRGPHGWERNYG